MKIKIIFITVLMLLSVNVHASIAGKPVILVHGLQFDDLQSPLTSNADMLERSREYFGDFWTQRGDIHHFWSTSQRVSGGIKDQFRQHFENLEASGQCANGCIWVTHSTGDLVLRDALSRLGQWGIDRNRVRVLAVIDLAGAGGGTELADLAISVAEGGGLITAATRGVVSLFVGFDVNGQNLGVVNDLRPAAARNIAKSNQPYPRLRFAGTGSEFLSVTKPFISGSDDSVVPLHSACGALRKGSFDSCSTSITNNGILTSANGPSSFIFNHFPIIMAERTGHNDMRTSATNGGIYATIINNASFNGLNVDFDDSTRRRFFAFGRRVRTLNNGSSKSISGHIFDTLNN